MADISTNIQKSIGYNDLFNDTGSGQSGAQAISDAYSKVQSALAQVKDNQGDPSKLMELQVQMNTLQQFLSSFTQLINGLKQSTDGINRNIG